MLFLVTNLLSVARYAARRGGIDGIWIGYGTGSMSVDGIGSSLVNRGGGFSVTSSTSATLKITNGATVSAQGNGAFIGGDPWGNPSTPKGSITVDGAGSALNIVEEQFYVGFYGSGTLTVSRGASVTAMGTYAVTGLAVPETSTFALLLTATLGGLLLWRRRSQPFHGVKEHSPASSSSSPVTFRLRVSVSRNRHENDGALRQRGEKAFALNCATN